MDLRTGSTVINVLSLIIHAGLFGFIAVQGLILPASSSIQHSAQLRRQNSNKVAEINNTKKTKPSLWQRLKDASNLVKIQLWYMFSIMLHILVLLSAEWTTSSEIQCIALRKYITASKTGIFFVLTLFLYFKAMTVSIDETERRKLQSLVKGCLAALPFTATLAPFVSNGVIVNGYCIPQVNWIFCVVGLAGFIMISFIYTYWFIKPVLEMYKNRKRMELRRAGSSREDNSSQSAVASHVRNSMLKIVWVNFISCVVLTSAITLWMLYMTVVMTIYKENWQANFMVGLASSIEAIFSALSLLMCTIGSYKCGGDCLRTGDQHSSQEIKDNATSTGTTVTPNSPTVAKDPNEPDGVSV